MEYLENYALRVQPLLDVNEVSVIIKMTTLIVDNHDEGDVDIVDYSVDIKGVSVHDVDIVLLRF